MMEILFFSLKEKMKCIGDHPFVAAWSSDLRIHRRIVAGFEKEIDRDN